MRSTCWSVLLALIVTLVALDGEAVSSPEQLPEVTEYEILVSPSIGVVSVNWGSQKYKDDLFSHLGDCADVLTKETGIPGETFIAGSKIRFIEPDSANEMCGWGQTPKIVACYRTKQDLIYVERAATVSLTYLCHEYGHRAKRMLSKEGNDPDRDHTDKAFFLATEGVRSKDRSHL